MNMRQAYLLALALLFAWTNAKTITIKSEADVFKKWHEWQGVFAQHNIQDAKNLLDTFFSLSFKRIYEDKIYALRHLRPFLISLTNNTINEHGHQFRPFLDATFKKNIADLYDLLEQDILAFIQFLNDHNFASEMTLAKQESHENWNQTIDSYTALLNALFPYTINNIAVGTELQFEIANRFFRFCFSPETFPIFQNMLNEQKNLPAARLLYATIWYHLAGTGWKNWSAQALKNIKEQASQGKKIVYIAGGSDVLQLLKNGVYNITIVDPQLPSQPKYYTNEWEWLIKGEGSDGGIGDCLTIDSGEQKITLRRSLYKPLGSFFKARLADGQIIALEKSFTTWDIFDEQNNKLGTYSLERRFAEQADFIAHKAKALVISFNELYFISLPDCLNGWGIEPHKFSQNLTLFVKQLHEPVGKQEVCAMRMASLINASDFRFLALGTCIN
ncbi:hypothetical protein K2W90_02295 [Candidatus Babeliales bacterium]|nr:hypothetical protein [Candidatus Babeliales bacterium]